MGRAVNATDRSLVRRWQPGWPVDLGTTLGPLLRGRSDPTATAGDGGIWWAVRSPTGPATLHYRREGDLVVAHGWGPGAAEQLDRLPELLGAGDDPAGFDARAHPVMAAAHARFGRGYRVPRTGRVLEALVPAVLEQRVTGREARASWAWLVRRFGEPAPGPRGAAGSGGPPALMVAPDAAGWASIPSWDWHRAGVDPGRARTVVMAAQRAVALERLTDRQPADAAAALRTLPGIGVWTAAEVAVRAWGDADAVSFGDYHIPDLVAHALTGRRSGDDELLAELLAPWAGHRARAVRLLELARGHPPRRGPRAAITDHRGR